ncbi:MAG: DUF2007 domain-containing protein [Clostridia bacterium]|nr:DUF2007 domain-containing protein [Clostridia bacterium]
MDKFFGLDKAASSDGNAALLVTVHDDVECNILCSILEEEKIPHLVKDRGTGEVMRILAGYSMYGSDIFVPKEYLEQAQELLEAYRNGEVCEDAEEFSESDSESDE